MDNRRNVLWTAASAGVLVATSQLPVKQLLRDTSFGNLDSRTAFDKLSSANLPPVTNLLKSNLSFIKKPEDLLDEKLLSKNLGAPIFVLDNEFSKKIYGDPTQPNEELRQLGEALAAGKDITKEQKAIIVNAVRQAFIKQYPDQPTIFQRASDDFFIDQTQSSYTVLTMAEGKPVGTLVGLGGPIYDKDNNNIGGTVTVGSKHATTWTLTNPTVLKYAGQDMGSILNEVGIGFRLHEILAEEIQHCAQYLNATLDRMKKYFPEEKQDEWGSSWRQLMELGGKLSGVSVAQNLASDSLQGKKRRTAALALNQSTTAHITMRLIASGGKENAAAELPYAYDLSIRQLAVSGEVLKPKQLGETRLALMEKVLEPYELNSDAKREAFTKYGVPTFRDLSARLHALLKSGELSPRMVEMARMEAAAFERIGVLPSPNNDHLHGWQRVQQKMATTVEHKTPAP